MFVFKIQKAILKNSTYCGKFLVSHDICEHLIHFPELLIFFGSIKFTFITKIKEDYNFHMLRFSMHVSQPVETLAKYCMYLLFIFN